MYGPTQCVADSSSEWLVCEAISLESNDHTKYTPVIISSTPKTTTDRNFIKSSHPTQIRTFT